MCYNCVKSKKERRMFMLMSLLILIPVLASVFVYKLPFKLANTLLWLVQIFLIVSSISLFINSHMNEYLLQILGGNDSVLYISLRGDRLSFIFVILSGIFFSAIHLFSYKTSFYENKFMMLCMVLQGVINGLFLTNDIFNMFVLFEVSTVVLVLLVYYQKTRTAIYNGLYFMVIQVLSMMFFLFGIAYLYRIFGILSIDGIAARIPYVESTSLILPASLLFVGLAVKLGFFPLFSWIRVAYTAASNPISVQAIQSGLFIKTSVFVLARFAIMFQDVLGYNNILLAISLITSIVGFSKALSQKNPVLILAFHTVSQVGLMCAGFFLSEKSYYGGMYHSINHAFFKTLLFLATGHIMHNYKTTNIKKIRGVLTNMPFCGVMVIIGILGITGAPFFNGYISKYMIMDGQYNIFITAALWIINMGTILSFTKFGTMLFGHKDLVCEPVSITGKAAMIILAVFTLALGVFGTEVMTYLFEQSFSITMGSHIQKSITYILMMLAGFLFYKYVLSRTDILYRSISGSMNLSNATFAMMIFFVVLMVYGYIS